MWHVVVFVGVALGGVITGHFLQRRGRTPEWLRIRGPLVLVRLGSFERLLAWLAGPRRFWRVSTSLGAILAYVSLLFTGGLLAWAVGTGVTPPGSLEGTVLSPAIPLPLWYLVVFVASLALHELGHGVVCYVEEISVETVGLTLLTVLPLTAYVEQDGESRQAAPVDARIRLFAAGVTVNFALAMVALVLLLGPVAGSIVATPGVHVGSTVPGSPADAAGVERGDVVTAINGTTIQHGETLDDAVQRADGRTVRLTLADGETVLVERGLVVTSTAGDLPPAITAGGAVPVRTNATRITAVNGTPVHTESEFADAVGNETVVTLETTRGSATVPLGASVRSVAPDGPLAAAGATTDDASLVITHVDGHRVQTATDLRQLLRTRSPGATVPVRVRADGVQRTYMVTLAAGDTRPGGRLGVDLAPGYGGVAVDDVGVSPYPTSRFLDGLRTGAWTDRVTFLLVAPVASTSYAHGFAGFAGATADFYAVSGPLEALGAAAIPVASLVFWCAWFNLVFAVGNCLPTLPADGGHLLRAGIGLAGARYDPQARRTIQTVVTLTGSFVTLVAVTVVVIQIVGS